jgi:hypothetical protein
MRIITNSEIDPRGIGTWAVVAEWFGAERVVFQGDLFKCVTFARAE